MARKLTHTHWTHERDTQLKALRSSGFSAGECAERLGVTYPAVTYRLKCLGLKNKHIFTADDDRMILELAQKGFTAQEVADYFGLRVTSIRARAQNSGIKFMSFKEARAAMRESKRALVPRQEVKNPPKTYVEPTIPLKRWKPKIEQRKCKCCHALFTPAHKNQFMCNKCRQYAQRIGGI